MRRLSSVWDKDSVTKGQQLLEIFKGKQITDIKVSDYELTIKFTDDTGLVFTDCRQCCCEYRYMTCDDDLNYFIKSTFYGAEIRDGDSIGDGAWEVHDVEFLIIKTSKGYFTIANHNEHNGYYGGFDIRVEELKN